MSYFPFKTFSMKQLPTNSSRWSKDMVIHLTEQWRHITFLKTSRTKKKKKTSKHRPWVFCYSWFLCTFESLLHILPKVVFLSCGHPYHLLFGKICEAPSKSVQEIKCCILTIIKRKLKCKIRTSPTPYSFAHIHPCQTKSCRAWDLF